MKRFLASIAVATTLTASSIVGAAESAASLFRVGDTGIRCLKAPCPWRGVVPVDQPGGAAGDPAYAGEAPPVIAAAPDGLGQARAEIWRAWATGHCLLVFGRFERRGTAAMPVLSVDHIVGPCEP
jgi:hypothetical protein